MGEGFPGEASQEEPLERSINVEASGDHGKLGVWREFAPSVAIPTYYGDEYGQIWWVDRVSDIWELYCKHGSKRPHHTSTSSGSGVARPP